MGDGGPDPFLLPEAQEPEYDFLSGEFVNPAGPVPTIQEAAAAVMASQEKPEKAKKATKKADTPKQAPKANVPDALKKSIFKMVLTELPLEVPGYQKIRDALERRIAETS